MKISLSLIILLFGLPSMAQFDPAGGQPGSISIHSSSPNIMGWADSIVLQRGYKNIALKDSGYASTGQPNMALGAANGHVVSLGDSGVAILKFNQYIINKPGADFAVFENGFNAGAGYFLELAFVEVSKDGKHYVRFPAISKADTSVQTKPFGVSQCQKYKGLAGKHQAPYGTLFNLEDIEMDSVQYVKIIDVVGSINKQWASRDSAGNIINDPYPTQFASGGFDLDAVARVEIKFLGLKAPVKAEDLVFPNPIAANRKLNIKTQNLESWELIDMSGRLIDSGKGNNLHISKKGYYFIIIKSNNSIQRKKICVL